MLNLLDITQVPYGHHACCNLLQATFHTKCVRCVLHILYPISHTCLWWIIVLSKWQLKKIFTNEIYCILHYKKLHEQKWRIFPRSTTTLRFMTIHYEIAVPLTPLVYTCTMLLLLTVSNWPSHQSTFFPLARKGVYKIRLFNKTLLGYQPHQMVYSLFNHLMWLVAQEFYCIQSPWKLQIINLIIYRIFILFTGQVMPKILSKFHAMFHLSRFPYSGAVNLQPTFIQPQCWRIPSLSTTCDCFCLYLEATSLRYHQTWCQRVHWLKRKFS